MDIVRSRVKRMAIAIAGGTVLVLGIIMIPYPGPGWLVVFAGLGILSTEFAWARDVLHYAKGKYDTWQAWVKTQPMIVRLALIVLTGVVVVLTLWLLNVFSLIDSLLPSDLSWLHSPLPIFTK